MIEYKSGERLGFIKKAHTRKSVLVQLYFYAFGFSQLSTKYETTKPPAMRVVSKKCYTK